MALNIPMPSADFGGQLSVGSQNMFNQLLNKQLNQQKMMQQQKQFEQEQSRLGQLAPLQRKLLQQQIIGAQNKNDPNYEFNQYKALQDMIMGNGQPQQQQPQQPMPTQEMGQGMGMFSQDGMADAQQQQQPQQPMQQPQGGQVNFDALKQNPILRGYFKHKFGFDPLASVPQTPQEKQSDALELFKQKEDIRLRNKSGEGEALTTPVKTKLQNVITGVDSALPILADLADIASEIPTGLESMHPAAYAAYNAKVNGIIEPLIGAMGLNVSDSTKEMMKQQISRVTNESPSAYRKRLLTALEDLKRRRAYANSTLKTGKVPQSNDDVASASTEELQKIIAGGA